MGTISYGKLVIIGAGNVGSAILNSVLRMNILDDIVVVNRNQKKALGEVLDYRLCMTVCGLITIAVCWLTVFLRRRQVRQVLADRPGVDQIR